MQYLFKTWKTNIVLQKNAYSSPTYLVANFHFFGAYKLALGMLNVANNFNYLWAKQIECY